MDKVRAKRRLGLMVAVGVVVTALLLGTGVWAAFAGPKPSHHKHYKDRLTAEEYLGKVIFFDKRLSEPKGQACAACHAPGVGFTGPSSDTNLNGAVYEGAVRGRFGNRKPPSAAYAGDSPLLRYDTTMSAWVGGMFWDGRATGATLGDPLAEQAMGPFLNPLEQNNPSAASVVDKVAHGPYRALFEMVWGKGSLASAPVDVNYERIARSIAAYERSAEVTRFTSRFDRYLATGKGLSGKEKLGLQLFEGKAKCSNCHVSKPGVGGKPPVFTDFTYDNLGVPKNPMNPFYLETAYNPAGTAWVDEGLGGYLKASGQPANVYGLEMGKFKVPTLRNIARMDRGTTVKAYGHNGYFKSLKAIVHFYNTRDVVPWPAPELAQNVNVTEVGNLGLTPAEEDAIVAFLGTLSDL